MKNIVALNELRQHMSTYVEEVRKGQSFVIFKRNQPLFRMSPVDTEDRWEEVIDFTKIKKGGVDIDDLLSRL